MSAPAMSVMAQESYVFAYFADQKEGMRLAASEDGLNWRELNGGRPVLVPQVGKEKLLRDPSVVQGPDGTFHAVWTTSWRSPEIGYASSKDLVHWSEQRVIPVMADFPSAKNAWAPEITFDDESGEFYIYWASTLAEDVGKFEFGHGDWLHRIYLTTTKDFKAFTPTRLWFAPPFTVIDAAIVKTGGKWMMVVKNEDSKPRKEKNLRVTFTDSLAKGFPVEVSAPINSCRESVEGPAPLVVGDEIFVYFDMYRDRRYGMVSSSDCGRTWRDRSREVSLPKGIRHGTAFNVSGLLPTLSACSVHEGLRKGFENPPPEVKVGCYYYWVNERVDPEGVRKDLEWMKSVGIARAFLCTDIRNRFTVEDEFGPADALIGPNEFMSDYWWENLRTALKVAGELGIEMGLFNCPGWSQSGGPWVTEEDAQVAPDGSRPKNGPCSPKATGYEVSKTNRAAVRRHFDAFIGEILRRIPKEERPTLTTVVVDSWERGRVVKPEGDPRKLSDIIAEEYMGELTRCSHENGLITWCEPYTHSREGWDANGVTYGAAADEVAAEFWAGEPKNERTKEVNNALWAARRSGKNKVYAESFTAGRWEKHATDDWNFETLKPYADKFFHKGINATILHVVISQPGDDTEPPVRPWFGTFFDRRSKNAADTKRLVDYCRRCNFMLQAGKPHAGKTDERILDDGTIIRFTADSLFEVTFPDGHKETWNPERPKENRNEV